MQDLIGKIFVCTQEASRWGETGERLVFRVSIAAGEVGSWTPVLTLSMDTCVIGVFIPARAQIDLDLMHAVHYKLSSLLGLSNNLLGQRRQIERSIDTNCITCAYSAA
jgi:hypothetical protein